MSERLQYEELQHESRHERKQGANQQCEPEVGYRARYQSVELCDTVNRSSRIQCSENAEEQADNNRYEQSVRYELQRSWRSLRDVGRNRPLTALSNSSPTE